MVTFANVHDIAKIYALICEDDHIVYGDSGYLGVEVHRNTGEDRSFTCGLPHCPRTLAEPHDKRIQKNKLGHEDQARESFSFKQGGGSPPDGEEGGYAGKTRYRGHRKNLL